ncbi:thioredoxin domain-containing protein 2-like [Argonauta hians]
METVPNLKELNPDKECKQTEEDGKLKNSTEYSAEEQESEETMPETSQAQLKTSPQNETSEENDKSQEDIPLPKEDSSLESTDRNSYPPKDSTVHQRDQYPKKELENPKIETIKNKEEPNPHLKSPSEDNIQDLNSSFILNYIGQDLPEASKKSNSKTQELDSLIKYYLKQDSRKNSDGIFIAPVHKLGSQNSRLNSQLPVNLNHSGQEEFLLSDPEYSLNSVILDSVKTKKLACGINAETINASSSKQKSKSCELWQSDKDRNKIIESLESASQNYCKAMKTLEDLAERLKTFES